MQAVRNDLAKAEKSAERFFGALRDVFVGAPVRQRIMAKSEEKDEGERQKDKVRNLSLLPSPFSLLGLLLATRGKVFALKTMDRLVEFTRLREFRTK